MKNFAFSIPIAFCFGNNCVKRNPEVFSSLGKKAFIFTSKFFPDCKNYALQDVEELLGELGIEYTVYDECIENPPVMSCVKASKLVEEYNPDFLIAVGGGSVIDTCKAANMLLKYPGHDVYETLFTFNIIPNRVTEDILGTWRIGPNNNGKYPFISIPTTAGTGSEITGASVLDREDIDNKAGTAPFLFANYSFIDPRYIMEAPAKLNKSTALDALGHGLEPYIDTGSRDNYMVEAMGEIGFKLFAQFKDHLLADAMTEEDYEKQALACTIFGFCETLGQTGVPHGLGYPLTHVKGIPHGLACGIFEGEYLKVFKDTTKVMRALNLMGFDSIDEFADYVHAVLDQYVDITVTRAEIDEWTDTFYNTAWRVARHPEPFTPDDVKGIYERTLAKFIVD